MKGILVKTLLAGLLSFVLTCLYVFVQYWYQGTHPRFYIRLGFPYQFYFFTPDFELHGGNPLHLIYDLFLLFVFSFLIIHIGMNIRKKRKAGAGNECVDEGIS